MSDEPPNKRPLTRPEVLEKLGSVPVFTLKNTDNNSQCAAMISYNLKKPDGTEAKETKPCVTFYLDWQDANAERGNMVKVKPDLNIAIECSLLDRAFAISEQWVKQPPGCIFRLQASKFVLSKMPDFPALPDDLRSAFNPFTSKFPLWVLPDLHVSGEEAPFFFDLETLTEYWCSKTGKPAEEMPKEMDVTDLRVLIARMVSQPNDWTIMRLVPHKSTKQIMQNLKEAARESGEEPPPLDEAAEAAAAAAKAGAKAKEPTEEEIDAAVESLKPRVDLSVERESAAVDAGKGGGGTNGDDAKKAAAAAAAAAQAAKKEAAAKAVKAAAAEEEKAESMSKPRDAKAEAEAQKAAQAILSKRLPQTYGSTKSTQYLGAILMAVFAVLVVGLSFVVTYLTEMANAGAAGGAGVGAADGDAAADAAAAAAAPEEPIIMGAPPE